MYFGRRSELTALDFASRKWVKACFHEAAVEAAAHLLLRPSSCKSFAGNRITFCKRNPSSHFWLIHFAIRTIPTETNYQLHTLQHFCSKSWTCTTQLRVGKSCNPKTVRGLRLCFGTFLPAKLAFVLSFPPFMSVLREKKGVKIPFIHKPTRPKNIWRRWIFQTFLSS